MNYKNRRTALCKAMKNGVVLLLGNKEQPRNFPSNIFTFRQDSTFLYYTGLTKPGLALIILPESGTSILFGNDPSIESIIWSGKGTYVKDLAEQAGIEKTEPVDKLGKYIATYLGQKQKVHYFKPYQATVLNKFAGLLNISQQEVSKQESKSLIKSIVAQREIKEDNEIEEIEKTLAEGTGLLFNKIRAMAREGEKESNILAAATEISLQHGNGMAFTPIISVNGEILHNPWYKNKLEKGRLLIADAGVESYMGYATDITRTYPVNGDFTGQQKEIYDIVLHTLKSAVDLVQPGTTYKEVHYKACVTMVDGLKNAGLLQGNTEDIVHAGAHALFFPHGLGHMMGLDVHDMENLGEDLVGYDEDVKRSDQFGTAYLRLGKCLKENMVITVEPGIYFIPAFIEKWKSENRFRDMVRYDKLDQYMNFGGIRIEDDVLVTNNGCRVLSSMIPW